MKVEGADAARYDAVRRDSCATINTGPLTSADDQTGHVEWLDRAGVAREVTLGAGAIHIQAKSTYRR